MWGIKIKTLLQKFCADKSGATAIEYGLIASLIAVAIITSVEVVGTENSKNFDNVSTKWDEAVASQAN
ncbi:Flp family type IVb pilin [Hirschia baltica]|uniref:Flp/Fap pilin component n=1 Tax=Hirschia baltica (strain ATCC 49814 / DSM 5838 / IFAM 1418) TaxID=582402 RepID=C6XPX4_HIRBI|nr:Flp family type IVb pilin [Hirschia baltica]ACT58491.1 Flp/Fap pilin component [Hirschia baltica ATCC 49814]